MSYSTRILEFDKVLDRLASHTSFSAGRALALLLEPAGELDEVERRQAATAEALQLADQKPDLTLGGASDVRPEVARAALGGMLLTGELLAIAALARCSRRWRISLVRLQDHFPTLAAIAERLSEHHGLPEDIAEAVGENGEVLDRASPELRRLRGAVRAAQDRLRGRLQEIVSSPATRLVLQEPIITERGGRYVVPVKAEHRGKLRGIVHDQSASGATLFVEPLEVVELANRWRQLQVEEDHEIERVLRALSERVAGESDELERSVTALAELDLQQAKARLAAATRATRPRIVDFERAPGQPLLRLVEARHPLLGPEVVPLSLDLGLDFDQLVITGPNTGGKTVALKTIGLLTLMAQAGLQLPAKEGCRVASFHSVYADIGDEQSIEQSLSTFSSHVTHIVEMLREADDRTLVLLDEIGAGTDPQEGSALARAILEHLRQRRVLCVATTHYTELKLYAHAAPRVENASVEFDPRTLSPTYRLLVGLPGHSNALEIAARLGVPRVIVDRARQTLDPADLAAGRLLEQIQRERREAEDARRLAERERQAAAGARAQLERELSGAQIDRRRAWQEAEQASHKMLTDLRREIAGLRNEARRQRTNLAAVEQLAAEATNLAPLTAPAPAEAAASIAPVAPESTQPLLPRSLQIGVEVLVPSLGIPGTVTRLEGTEAEVEVRGMRVRLALADLAGARPPSGAERALERQEANTRVNLSTVDRQVSLQLDLRGQRRDEAAEALDRYLNDAYLTGLKSVRVVHGKGTGAVRQAVHELLEHHPLVRHFASAAREAGGDGATEVDLVA